MAKEIKTYDPWWDSKGENLWYQKLYVTLRKKLLVSIGFLNIYDATYNFWSSYPFGKYDFSRQILVVDVLFICLTVDCFIEVAQIKKVFNRGSATIGKAIESMIRIGRLNTPSGLDLPQVFTLYHPCETHFPMPILFDDVFIVTFNNGKFSFQSIASNYV